MSSFNKILYHLVICTKERKQIIDDDHCEKLYLYMWGIFKSKNCKLFRVNGGKEHIHMVFSLHPSVALADLVKDIKLASSKWIKEENLFPRFSGWGLGYGAFTYSTKEKDILIEYVKRQKEHHRKTGFFEEFRNLLIEHKIEFNEKFLMKDLM